MTTRDYCTILSAVVFCKFHNTGFKMISVSEARRHNICSNTEEVEHLKWEGCGWASKNVYDLNRSVKSFLLHGKV